MSNRTKIKKTEMSSHTAAVMAAARAIPPLWPLASSVAVNPFLGQSEESLAHVGARLERVAGINVTMPYKWYLKKIASGAITNDDLAAALAEAPKDLRPADAASLREDALEQAARKEHAGTAAPAPEPLKTVADLAADASGTDWPGLIANRFGAWAADYFDVGQALWQAPHGKAAYAAWRSVASHDLTPEIAGLTGFAAHVVDAPQTASDVVERVVALLDLPAEALETYFHQMLMSLGGWSQYARFKLWQAELAGGTDQTITDFLAIRLLWEEALFNLFGDDIKAEWKAVCAEHATPVVPTRENVVAMVLQEASERAAQRDLAALLSEPGVENPSERPAFQAAFCIDVRSEVFRRALEAVDPSIRTLGFAGFFGVFASHRGFASDVDELRLPVLLNPTVHTCSGNADTAEEDQARRFSARAIRAWGRFKLAAVSSFAFVEATGPIYVGKLIRDGLGLAKNTAPNDPAPRFEPELDLPTRIASAETVLRAMSLTENFARLILLAGHGANVVNNPHASALACGACGGYSGEVNARALALLLNDPEVRSGVAERGIHLPEDTLFVGGLHDTTTDAVTLYDQDVPVEAHADDLRQARAWLEAAGKRTRAERALRLPRAEGEQDISARSVNWAEVRPEWALAGCKAFIAAPRTRSTGKNLEGRAFLHDYDWNQDSGFGVLELIMTAPVVVASWISLQYYGSTVAPQVFGAGNKLLHNVAGGIGVFEGNGGLLRNGLPWQSVHDGEKFAHEPLRLSVCIEAPREAMTDILKKHANVRALFDNKWLYLFALDEAGRMAWRYDGDLKWLELDREPLEPPVDKKAAEHASAA